jgi:hypothetical protein
MAGLPKARVNNLNQRMHDIGVFDQDLALEDATAINAFYDYTCLKCGAPRSISLDHVKPIMSGGTNTRDNIQNLCESCNKGKGQREEDYRKGRIVPADFVAPTAQDKRIKHDWMQLEHEYIVTNCSQRDLAQKYSIDVSVIGLHASANDWTEKRKQFASETQARVNEIVAQSRAENNVAALDLCDSIVSQFMQEMAKGKSKVTASDAIAAARFRSVLQGGIDSRREEVVKDWRDYAKDLGVKPEDVIAEFERTAAGYESGDDSSRKTPSIGEEEAGVGWSD